MRIGLIGDVHAEDEYLSQAVAYLKTLPVDHIFCTGDIIDGRGNVNKCCETLAHENIQTVKGNHERWLLEDGRDDLTPIASLNTGAISFLKSLPKTLDIESPLGNILFCHGFGENDMAKIMPNDPEPDPKIFANLHSFTQHKKLSFIINGHSHKRMVRKFKGLTIINVGTLFYKHRPCFAAMNCENGTLQFFDFIDNKIVSTSNYRLSQIPNEQIPLHP